MKTKTTLLLFIMLGTFQCVHAQHQFQKSYGIGNAENGYAIEQTPDGGYFVAGHNNFSSVTYSGGMFLKLDANGDTMWTRLYDTPAYDHFWSATRTSDGHYIATGPTGFVFGTTDIYLVKTDSTGGIVWSKTYGGGGVDEMFKLIETSDGNYLLAGGTSSFGTGSADIYLVKVNQTNGDTLWTSVIGTTGNEGVKDLFETSSGTFVLAGSYPNPALTNDLDMAIVYVNAGGNIAGVQTISGPGNEQTFDLAEVIEPTSDGGFIVGGRSNNWGPNDIVLMKFDSTTSLQWSKNYGASINEYIFDIKQLSDGGYIFVGSSTSINPNIIMAIAVRTNSSGDTLWTRSYHFGFETEFYAVDNTTDGGFVFTGFIKQGSSPGNNNIFVVKVDANGNSGCNEFATTLTVTSITPTIGNENMILTHGALSQNNTDVTGGGLSVATYCFTTGIAEPNAGEETISVYPNPAIGEFTIHNSQFTIKKVEMYNVLGEEVYSKQPETSNADALVSIFDQEQVTVNVSSLVPGVYFVRLVSEKAHVTRKIVVQR